MTNILSILATYYESSTDGLPSVFWFGFAISSIILIIPLIIAIRKGVIQTTVFGYFKDFSAQVVNALDANARNKRIINDFLVDTRQTRDALNAFKSRTSRKETIVHSVKSTINYDSDRVIAEMESLAKDISIAAEEIKYNFFSAISEINRGAATKEVYEYLNSKPKTAKAQVDYSNFGVNQAPNNVQQPPESRSTGFDTFHDKADMDKAGIDGVMFRKNYQYIIRYKDATQNTQLSGEQLNAMQNQGKKPGVDFIVIERIA